MESTVTSSAMSASLLARNVYCVCFTDRDSLDSLWGELACAREKYFTGGRKAVKVGKAEVIRGFSGKLQGKLSRHSFFWRKTARGVGASGHLLLEEAFDHRGGYVLVKRDFRDVIASRTYFDKSHIWLRSVYYEPWNTQNPQVMFKPVESDNRVERFDWDQQTKHYRSTMLYPVPYSHGTPGQSVINARFGEPRLLVSTEDGIFCYCPEAEAASRKKAWKELQGGTLVLLPVWEVKEGALSPEEEELGPGAPDVTFPSLEEYAQLAEPEKTDESAAGAGLATDASAAENPADTAPAPEKTAEPSAADPAAENSSPGEPDASSPGKPAEATEEETVRTEPSGGDTPRPAFRLAETAEADAPAERPKAFALGEPAKATEEEMGRTELPAGDGADSISTGEEAPVSALDPPAPPLAPLEDPEAQAILQAARDAAARETLPAPAGERGPAQEERETQAILEAARREAGESPAADNGPAPWSRGMYQGEIQRGKPSGRGRIEQPGGLTAYDGEFRDGKREGFGCYYYKDGNLCYAGSWKEDQRDGLGVSFRDSDHALHISRWKEGVPGEFVSLFDRDGNLRYGGRMEQGKKQGAGLSYNQADGTVFVGKWIDGQPAGTGSSFDREGNLVYYGGWKDGKRNGHGTEFDKNGAIVFDGEWRDGKYYNGILYQKLDQEHSQGPETTGPFWDL